MTRIISSLAVGLALTTQPAGAFEASAPTADQIRIDYVQPKNPEHRLVYESLKQRQILERFRAFLSPFRLPRRLLLKVEGCDGDANAWYTDDAITVCYEYIDSIRRNAPKETLAGVTLTDTLIGPTVEVFLHEFAHAVFDYLKRPILGREEDAADQFASYVMLNFGKRDARRLIGGVAYMYYREAATHTPAGKDFANEHGTPAQRFYNILCLAYGADAELFADAVTGGHLPKDRAEGCKEEYEQIDFAMKTLIWPYIDEKRLASVREQRWLNFDDDPPAIPEAPASLQ